MEKVLCTPRHGRKTERQQIISYHLVFTALVAKVGHQTHELPFRSPSLVARPYARCAGLAAKRALKPRACMYSWCTSYAYAGMGSFPTFSLASPDYVDAQSK